MAAFLDDWAFLNNVLDCDDDFYTRTRRHYTPIRIMNGAATRRGEGFGPATRAPPGAGPPMPNGKVLVDSYRQDTLNGPDREKPRSNPVRPSLYRSNMCIIG